MRAALRIKPRQHRKRRPAAWPASLIAGVATTVTALSLLGAAPAGASSMAAAGPARPGTAHQSPAQTASPRDLVRATTPSDVPYALPVQLPQLHQLAVGLGGRALHARGAEPDRAA